MITPPATPVHPRSSSRSKYPNSNRFWQDRRTPVDVGAHASGTLQPSSPPPTTSTPAHQNNHVGSIAQHVHQQVNHILPVSVLELSEEQKGILEYVKGGKNIFFTGAAGTGKSVLLREIIKELRATLGDKAVAVTATTGIAGINIGGSTIHSFAGIGLGKESAEKLADRIRNSTRLKDKWCNTKVLIVDEISMMDGRLFDKLEYIARVVRKCKKPFGGLQLVLSGDFFQLPPVPEQSHNYRMPATCTFDALKWSECVEKTVQLTQVFRQRDNTFIDLLASMRVANLSRQHIEILKSLSRTVDYDDGIEPSELFPLKSEVENCNNNRLSALQGPEFEYSSMDKAGFDYFGDPIPKNVAETLLDRLVTLPKVTLKVGAQVMLIQNMVQGVLVNGSVGRVADFLTTHEAVLRGVKVAEISRKPESQDQTNTDTQSTEDMRPLNNNTFELRDKWPLVQFTNGHQLLCAPVQFTVVGHTGNIEALRLQVPVILAWAMSIHKSQGQTLERVKINLGRVFEKGHAYVALSRATAMERLEIVNLDPGKIMAHPRVVAWHHAMNPLANGLEVVEEAVEEAPQEDFNSELLEFGGSRAMSGSWDDHADDWCDTDDWIDHDDMFPD